MDDCAMCHTLDDISDDVMVYILTFLCPVYGSDSDNISMGSLTNQEIRQAREWPRHAFHIALSCSRLYRLLFLSPDNDTIFWKWHCVVFLNEIEPRPMLLKWEPGLDRNDLRFHPHIKREWPNGRVCLSQCGAIAKTIRFSLPSEISEIAPIGSMEHQQPNYFRNLTSRHHELHERIRQNLQRKEASRTKKYLRAKFIDKHVNPTLLYIVFSALFINCLLFYTLQTLRWFLVDMLQLDWFVPISGILQHACWLPVWLNIALLFMLCTAMLVYKVFICRNHNLIDVRMVAAIILTIFTFLFSTTLLLLYLATVLPKRDIGDPIWLQLEYIPWSVTVIPVILPFALAFGKSDNWIVVIVCWIGSNRIRSLTSLHSAQLHPFIYRYTRSSHLSYCMGAL